MEVNGKTMFLKVGDTRLNLAALIFLKHRPEAVNSLSAAFGTVPAHYIAMFSNGSQVELTEEEGKAALGALDDLARMGL